MASKFMGGIKIYWVILVTFHYHAQVFIPLLLKHQSINMYGGHDNMAVILQTTFLCAFFNFSGQHMCEFGFKFHKTLFLMVQIAPFPTAMVIEPSSLTHICITRFQWVNQNQNSSSKWITDILWYPVCPVSVCSFVCLFFWPLSL